jgi:Ca2+-binding RTX toxin-like protein
MVLEIVDPTSTEIEHLASVDVKFSGAHIGGGIYFSANHNPTPGGSSTAVPQSSLTGEAESHATTELDYTLPTGDEPWDDYRGDIDGDGTLDFVLAGFDMALHVGDRLASTGEFYDGPSVPLLIANDPNDLSGDVTITGYPSAVNSLDGTSGTLHQTTGTLALDGYTDQTVGVDAGGYFTIDDAEAVGGMSGGGNFLDFDANGDGATETYLIGSTARACTIEDDVTGEVIGTFVQSTSFSPHYADLAAAIESLAGDDARTADDFPRMTLLSAQTLGSTLTTVQGQFFHEDIYGGVNADTLLGAGGDDHIFGREGADSIDGGTGADRIDGGSGGDTLSGGTGADWFVGSGLGGGATDIITDFEATGGDVIDLSSYFATLDDVVAATADLGDGSILISLPIGLGGGAVQVLGTTVADLSAINVNVVCFTEGTLILTPHGEKPVETLVTGDQVLTYSGQAKPLRAINVRRLGLNELHNRPNLWPVVLSEGALGPNIPRQRLRVSPQHRILVNSKISERMVGSPALVPAKKLLDLPSVTQPRPKASCTYIHLVFEEHEIIQANGCWSESFYPGDQAMTTLPYSVVLEYLEIFGGKVGASPQIIEGKRARNMVDRHHKNSMPIQESRSPYAN